MWTRRNLFGVLVVALAYWVVILATSPASYSDTSAYASAAVGYEDHGFSENGNPFWEFGHVLWRPAAWVLWRAGKPLLQPHFAGNRLLEVSAALVVLNLILGFLAALLVYGLARKLTARTWEAWVVALVFICANPILNYVQTGMAYVPGLACQCAALYLLAGVAEGAPATRSRLWGAGVCLALSVLLWFPYVLSCPGILAAALFWKRDPSPWRDEEARRRIRFLVPVVVVAALVVGLVYASIMLPNGITTLGKTRAWVATAGHGWSQDRTLLRLGTGLPRALMDLGNDGLILKRFLFRDPYAPVSAAGLLRLGLWKVVLVYFSLMVLVYRLWRTRQRGILLALVIAALPVLLFALLLFEPGSPERFMPVFPVLFPAFAAAFAGFSLRDWSKSVLALLFVSIVAANLGSYGLDAHRGDRSAIERITVLQEHFTPNSVVVLLSYRDQMSRFFDRHPFDPINVRGGLPLYAVITAGTAGTATWASEFANCVLETWKAGGEVWLSKRLLSARPKPDWNWVESEDRRIAWVSLPRFFHQLDTGADVGGDDGFLRLERSEHNGRILLSALAGGAR